jgi:hypothetical protein
VNLLEQVTQQAAIGAGLAGLGAGAVVLLATRQAMAAVGALLDLLLAAGLLRLAGDPSWTAVSTAAAIVLLRRLIGVGLRAGARSRSYSSASAGPASAGGGH